MNEQQIPLTAGKPDVDAAWIVYTDGSSLSNPGPSGWGIVVIRPDGCRFSRVGSARHTTNNRAELRAMIEGLRVAPADAPAVLYADSKYVVEGATKWRQGWQARGMKTSQGKAVANADLWEILWDLLDARPNARLQWTKGHAGTEGNETVDCLARAAAELVRAGHRPVRMVEACA